MKKKSNKVIEFINSLHEYITSNPQFRKDTGKRSEREIQAEIRPLIIQYLQRYFENSGVKDSIAMANKAFYWEGQEGQYGKERAATFGSRNYPDFIITRPYLVAIEYKQSPTGSTVKHGIGQSMMHTLSDDFDYVYYLFHDETKDKRIERSIGERNEQLIIDRMQDEFNVFIKFV